ncbi:JAB domain-containing protein, partial [Candidatus Pacearchaeota archaeon]|nr:JAB domain-containing protein [Candidatus Pacearchaeota archaeon]
FLKFGAEALSDAELFAIILRTGSKGDNVIEMSNRLISKFGLTNLFDSSLKELQEVNGIGPNKAMQILSIAELSKRYENEKSGVNKINKITCAEDVFKLFHRRLRDKKQEHFFILMLNSQNNIIAEQEISKGVLDAAIIDPRAIFNPAIKNSASKIILKNNHPSGNPEPSQEDLDITEKIIKSGEEISIKVLDHVLIAKDGWWSWKER